MTKTYFGPKVWHVVAREGVRSGKTRTFDVMAWDKEGVENIMRIRGYKKVLQCTRMR